MAQNDDICKKCDNNVPFHAKDCPYCCEFHGFPNVRAANQTTEIEALEQRYQNALNLGSQQVMDKFFNSVDTESHVVMCRAFCDTISLLNTDAVFQPFHKMVAIGARIAKDNKWDKIRGAVGSSLFPEYHTEINYGLLSLDSLGDSYYGGYSLTIDCLAIKDRTTFFESDSVQFYESHHLEATEPAPQGYRATWQNRAKLAISKLAHNLDSSKQDEDFPNIIFKRTTSNQDTGDYIEAHIYGGVKGTSIVKVLGATDYEEAELILIKRAILKLQQSGVNIEYGE